MRDVPGPVDGAIDVGLKQVVLRTIDEAARRGAANVEAEHLLLVIAAGDDATARTLAEFGLDHASLEAALDAERAKALEVAGVAPISEERLRSTRRTRPGWGASLRDALRRAEFRTNRARGHTREERERLAIAAAVRGVLLADLGTVPRALAYAGVDRQALIARLEAR
jgi:ATP-dependent Clp protease ATP-binding subunit ClpA